MAGPAIPVGVLGRGVDGHGTPPKTVDQQSRTIRQAPLSPHPYAANSCVPPRCCVCKRPPSDDAHYHGRRRTLEDRGLCAECKQPLERDRVRWAKFCTRPECRAKRARAYVAANRVRRKEAAEARALNRGPRLPRRGF